jgi:tetratricopeptide (TPR) repeat protein
MSRLQRLVDQALASNEDGSVLPWFALTKGLAEYRAGRFDSALQFLDKAQSLNGSAPRATIDLIRAMAHHKLNDHQRAREFLEKAIARMDKELAKPGVEPLSGAENWLICHVLRREAERVVGVKAAAAADSTPGGGKP